MTAITSARARGAFRKLGVKLIAAALILLGLTLLADVGIRPIIESVNAFECHQALTEIINSAVIDEIDREDADYTSLVELTESSDGTVSSVRSNIVNINRLRAGVSSRIQRELERMRNIDVMVAVGTLTGFELLHGRGFKIGMTISPVGLVRTSIISEFSDAGINQTLHRIIIKIEAEADAVIPGFSTRVSVEETVVAAETVIVGKVPDAYTHVISMQEELVGTLEDYGAALP